jgi:predicted transcriptional regulator
MNDQGAWDRPARGTSVSGLGSLEVEILTAVWDRDGNDTTTHEIHDELLAQRRVAYATVSLVLKNLVRKGLLVRDRQRGLFAYRPAVAPELVADEVLDAVVTAFYRGRVAAAAHLLGLASALDEQQLEQLRERARLLQSEASALHVTSREAKSSDAKR